MNLQWNAPLKEKIARTRYTVCNRSQIQAQIDQAEYGKAPGLGHAGTWADSISRQDSNTIRQTQQGNGMYRCASIGQPVLKLLGCDRAVTAVIIRSGSVDLPDDWLGNPCGGPVGFFFYRVGTIMT